MSQACDTEASDIVLSIAYTFIQPAVLTVAGLVREIRARGGWIRRTKYSWPTSMPLSLPALIVTRSPGPYECRMKEPTPPVISSEGESAPNVSVGAHAIDVTSSGTWLMKGAGRSCAESDAAAVRPITKRHVE